MKRDGWLRDPSGVWILRFRYDWTSWDQNPKVLIDKGRLIPNAIPLLKSRKRMRRNLAIRMKRVLEKHGRKGYLLALDHVSPDLIDFYPVDAFVNTACPRIAIDDSVRYDKPLVTPYELEVALGEKKWENGYQFDEIP